MNRKALIVVVALAVAAGVTAGCRCKAKPAEAVKTPAPPAAQAQAPSHVAASAEESARTNVPTGVAMALKAVASQLESAQTNLIGTSMAMQVAEEQAKLDHPDLARLFNETMEKHKEYQAALNAIADYAAAKGAMETAQTNYEAARHRWDAVQAMATGSVLRARVPMNPKMFRPGPASGGKGHVNVVGRRNANAPVGGQKVEKGDTP